MIQRKIFKEIQKFYNTNTNAALMITGARQVGKSYIIDEFGKTYNHYIKIDFINNPEYLHLFSSIQNSNDILVRLKATFGNKLVLHDTLIFFDEVQECKEIITQIKYLVQENSYKYILSGSLLGTIMNDIRSIPVGYLTIMQMYPLDFEEFAKANGIIDEVFEVLKESFDNKKPLDEFIHRRFMDIFDLYMMIGGMPDCVKTYLQSQDLSQVYNKQKSIIELYKKDIAKYDNEEKLYIQEIYNILPSQLNNKNKRFILKNLNEYTKYKKFNNSFLWLKYAGVALPTYTANEPKTPLVLSQSTNLFKLYLNDIGLLSAMYGSEIQLEILSHNLDINFGAIYENYAAQELKAHGFDLFYYNNKKLGEVDFLIEDQGKITPIEIKSGKYYKFHHAINNLLNAEYNIKQGYVFCNNNVSVENNIIKYPIYMLMFVKKKTLPEKLIYSTNFEDINNII